MVKVKNVKVRVEFEMEEQPNITTHMMFTKEEIENAHFDVVAHTVNDNIRAMITELEGVANGEHNVTGS